MSLYNMAVGYAPEAVAVITMLNIDPRTVPRFRDAYIDVSGGDESPLAVVLTRTGGANRADYLEEVRLLRERPDFVDETDDTFDETFAHLRFRPTGEDLEFLLELVRAGREAGYNFAPPMDRFRAAVERLGDASGGGAAGQGGGPGA